MVLGVSYLRVLAQRPTGCCSASIHYAKSARLCVQEMRKFVDRHSDWASSDKVSEKWWWSYKRQRHDWKCAATVVVQHTSLCCNSWCHDITSRKASHCQSSTCGVRRVKASAWLARHEHIYRLVWFTWSIWWQCPSGSFCIQRVGSKWGWWRQVWWNGESCQWATGKFWECFCQKCNQ